MGRPPDIDRRVELLDAVVEFLASNGLAGMSLRPMARALGTSVNGLTHHFGSKEAMVVAALQRAATVQQEVQQRWLASKPGLSQADLTRRWWRWINSSPANLALVRLGLEAAALDAAGGDLPDAVRAEQITLWRDNIEARLRTEGLDAPTAKVEAALVKAMFSGLVLDLIATGQRRQLTQALEVGLARLEQIVWASAGLSEPAVPAQPHRRAR